MIRIEGLTDYQCTLLDEMWTKDTSTELYEWIESLGTHDAKEVDVLLQLVQLAYIDKEVNCVSDLSIANKMIESARKRVDK